MLDVPPSKDVGNPAELRNELSNFITLATVALRFHHPTAPEKPNVLKDELLRTLQHITTLLTAGTLLKVRGPSKDTFAPRVIALTANINCEAIESLVLVTPNTRSALSPETTELKSLQTTVSGEEVLNEWHKKDPDGHFKSIFAILELFRVDKPRLKSLDFSGVFLGRCERFHLYIVNHAYPKIAARILMGSRTWNRHPIDVLAAYPLDGLQKRLSFPRKLKVDKTGVTWLRNKYDIHPQTNNTSSSSYVLYQVTGDNVGRWIVALTDTFSGLRDALTTKGRSRNSLTLQNVVEVVPRLMMFRLLLKCELVAFLLSDGLLVQEMTAVRPGDLGLGSATERAGDAGNVGPGGDRIAQEAAENEEALENEEEARENDEENDVFVEDLMPNSPADTIIRYLKTIVAWTTAVDSLSAHSLPLPIHAYLISIPHPSFPPLNNVIANFKSTILDHPDLRDTKAEAAALLETDFKLEPWSVTDVSVHAEALMMGLARTFWSVVTTCSGELFIGRQRGGSRRASQNISNK